MWIFLLNKKIFTKLIIFPDRNLALYAIQYTFTIPHLFLSLFLLAACLACGNFIACFPDECHEYLSQLYPLFLANLEDSIPSVRQGAAVAIGNLVKTYGEKEKESVIKDGLQLTQNATQNYNLA